VGAVEADDHAGETVVHLASSGHSGSAATDEDGDAAAGAVGAVPQAEVLAAATQFTI
jgi:hypothetical protein